MILLRMWHQMSEFARKMPKGVYTDPKALTSEERVDAANKLVFGLYAEVAELQNSYDWKPWKDGTDYDYENIKREIIDCMFFLHHIAEVFGISQGDLVAAFDKILENNIRRYHTPETTDALIQAELDSIQKHLNKLLEALNGCN